MSDPRLDELWLKLDATPAARLDQEALAWIASDPSRAPLADEAREAAALLRSLRVVAAEDRPAANTGRQDYSSRPRRISPWSAAVAAAAAAILVVILFSTRGSEPSATLLVAVGREFRDGDALDTRDDLHISGPAGRLQLGPRARLARLSSTPTSLALRLDQGRLFSSLKPAPATLSIETPAGTVTVTGTEFLLDVPPPDAADRSVFLVVREGSVRFANAHGSADVQAGMCAYMSADAAPSAARCAPGFLRATFLWTLTDMEVRFGLDGLVEALGSDDAYLREAARARLQRAVTDLDDVIPRLATRRGDPRKLVREGILRTLLAVDTPLWEGLLSAGLDDPEVSVALDVLEECDSRDRRASFAIGRAFRSPHDAVKIAAARAAGRRKLEEHTNALLNLQLDDNPRVVEAALEALRQLNR